MLDRGDLRSAPNRRKVTTAETLHAQVVSLYKGKRTQDITKELYMEQWDKHVQQHGYRCAVSGKAFDMQQMSTRPSVDQIIPSAGYWAGNIRFVTWEINWARGAIPDDRWLELCRGVVGYLQP